MAMPVYSKSIILFEGRFGTWVNLFKSGTGQMGLEKPISSGRPSNGNASFCVSPLYCSLTCLNLGIKRKLEKKFK